MTNTLQLDCIPQGIPNLYTFEPWEHTSNTGQHIRFLNGDHNGNLILNPTKQESSLQDTGIYICSVSNGITDRKGNLRQLGHKAISCNGRICIYITQKEMNRPHIVILFKNLRSIYIYIVICNYKYCFA